MSKKNVSLLEFENNPNIGLYMFVNDKFCLLGQEVKEKKKKEIEKILNVPIYHVNVLATELVGVFISGNNDFIFVPKIFDYELNKIKEICEKHGCEIIELDHRLNTFGNTICVGHDEIIINPNYSKKFVDEISKKTKKNVIKIKNKDFESIGGVCRFLNSKYFISQEFEEDEVKDILDKIGGLGSINSGSNYVSSGIVGNSSGLLIGSMSSTVEIQNVVESLDYL